MVESITLYFPRHPDWPYQRCEAVARSWGPICCSHHPLEYTPVENLRSVHVPKYYIEIGFRDEETGEFFPLDDQGHHTIPGAKPVPLHLQPEPPELEPWEKPVDPFPLNTGVAERPAIASYRGRAREFTRDCKDIWSEL